MKLTAIKEILNKLFVSINFSEYQIDQYSNNFTLRLNILKIVDNTNIGILEIIGRQNNKLIFNFDFSLNDLKIQDKIEMSCQTFKNSLSVFNGDIKELINYIFRQFYLENNIQDNTIYLQLSDEINLSDNFSKVLLKIKDLSNFVNLKNVVNCTNHYSFSINILNENNFNIGVIIFYVYQTKTIIEIKIYLPISISQNEIFNNDKLLNIDIYKYLETELSYISTKYNINKKFKLDKK